MQPIDPTTEPFLSGRYAPAHDELDVRDLPVEGDLPRDLTGAYVRNGPNPVFTPLGSYTYPLEGDGMLHGVWLEGGTARYRNRTVRTQGLRAEERAGRALFGGLMSPAFVDQRLLGDDPDPGWPFKLDAFVNVVRHAGRTLALEECTPPYEVDAELETIGRYDFGGALPNGICAHPKVDPASGELLAFSYDVADPFLRWESVAADGGVRRVATAVDGVDRAYMVHDFAITGRYVVLVLNPLVFDVDAMGAGGSLLGWRPDLGCRVALVPRDGGAVRWAQGDAFWAWHFANAFDDGRLVHVDVPWSNAPAMVLPPDQRPKPAAGFGRLTIDPDAGTAVLQHLEHDAGFEFPRIDDRRIGRAHRYVLCAGRSDDARLAGGEHDQLWRHDVVSGRREFVTAGAAIGEAVFAARAGAGPDELDGYYLAIGTDLSTDRSSLYVWDAAEFPAAPRARVVLPQRVPNGLHGNWFPTDG